MSAECPFCRKLQHLQELPADELVWQFPHSVVLLGPWQFYCGYCIVVQSPARQRIERTDPG